MRFFSLKFLKKTSSELELVTWEPECMIEPAKTTDFKMHTVIKNRNWGKFNSSAMLCGELEYDHVALGNWQLHAIIHCCK